RNKSQSLETHFGQAVWAMPSLLCLGNCQAQFVCELLGERLHIRNQRRSTDLCNSRRRQPHCSDCRKPTSAIGKRSRSCVAFIGQTSKCQPDFRVCMATP